MLKSIFYSIQLQYDNIKCTIVDIINTIDWDVAIGPFVMGRIYNDVNEQDFHLAGAVEYHHNDCPPAA